ncbi:MAG: hypothetical protein GY870_13870, partial [archaeon]|nr:hypothetical protein [archaeon]
MVARVDSETGRQELVMQKINPETKEVEIEDYIECIHTAVMDITPEEFMELENNIDAQEEIFKKTLNIRWSEDPRTINLTPEEHFKAFKSWVAGIAEAGVDAFEIQDEIDRNLNLMYPIVHFIMQFLVKCDPELISEYLVKIERECRFEGETHIPSLIANLKILFEYFVSMDDEISEGGKKFVRLVFDMDFPIEIYLKLFYGIKIRKFIEMSRDIRMEIEDKIDRDCKLEGKTHIPSLLA